MGLVDMNNKTILVTGAAGFIGSNLVKRICEENPSAIVIGIDNMNDYYDVALKDFRLNELAKYPTFTFVKGNIADKVLITEVFEKYKPSVVVNLAAQAGVRYSITNPDAYVESNLVGFFNILEACRHSYDNGEKGVEHLVYASSSSVYGMNKKVPYSTEDKVDNPISLYAATKKSNELMAHSYSKLYNIPSTGLRFFTVYGPAGRPDMAYFGFTNKLVKGETIKIFNYGNCKRDFTYVDDIVEGVFRVMKKAPDKKNGEDGLPIPPYAVYNIGNQDPENLLDFVQILSEELVRASVNDMVKKMRNETDVSVVMPVYKVEKYIEESVKSICEQNFFGEYELILVDDGSPDLSIYKAEAVIKRYPKMNYRVVHKENGGLPSARNYGLNFIAGKYVCFIDSDDIIEEHHIQKLFDLCEEHELIY